MHQYIQNYQDWNDVRNHSDHLKAVCLLIQQLLLPFLRLHRHVLKILRRQCKHIAATTIDVLECRGLRFLKVIGFGRKDGDDLLQTRAVCLQLLTFFLQGGRCLFQLIQK